MSDIGSAASLFLRLYGAVVGTITGSAVSAGNIGERISANVTTNTTAAATGTFGDLTSISLTAGSWDISALVVTNGNTGVNWSDAMAAISVNSGNTTTDHVNGLNVSEATADTVWTATTRFNLIVPRYHLDLSTTTTVYLKHAHTFTSGLPAVRVCSISATRVG